MGMGSQIFCLSKETAGQLNRRHDEAAVFCPIQHGDIVVALTQEGDLPARIVLPAGLDRVPSRTVSAKEISKSGVGTPPDVIALCYNAVVTVTPEGIEQAVRDLRDADAVTVNGKVFTAECALGDVVEVRGTADACDVCLFRAPQVRQGGAKVGGLAFTTVRPDGFASQEVAVDAVAYCGVDVTRVEVISLIALAVERLLSTAATVAPDLAVSMAHYPVLGSGLAITVVSPAAEEGEDEVAAARVAWRRSVHERLLLPMDRPMLKKSCRVYGGPGSNATAFGNGGWPGRLADVHQGVKSHGLGEGGVTEHLVQGRYLYCHYLQDKFNDSGWGCAYRSLQTILSWCALEKYATFTDGVIPTHKDIQTALVDVGDKPSTFLGSKEWIGANEVCYALEKLTGISSKILHVSRGAEMESKGRELARHFDEQGSPVMVGGGVLAWTILGVARNSRTGKTRFLILDPHYEGRDELTTIQSKGWVGWKSAEVFKADAFYNLCMPLRPSGV